MTNQRIEAPTQKELEGFAFYWEHLRRNDDYRKKYADWHKAIEESQKADAPSLDNVTFTLTRSVLGSMSVNVRTKALPYPPLDPDDPDNTVVEALRKVLSNQPDYFQLPDTKRMLRRLPRISAMWNRRGEKGLAWKYHESVPNSHTGPIPKGPALLFKELRAGFELAEKCLENQDLCRSLLVDEATRMEMLNATPEKYRQLWEPIYEKAKRALHKFLEEHPHMDFVLDTSLPWGTVAKDLEAIFEDIKQLRKDVELKDADPKRLRDAWKRDLELYDLCAKQAEPNRKKFKVLQRIWRERLGFAEAFKLLGVKLTTDERKVTEKLDNMGQKPAGVFNIANKWLKELERKLGESDAVSASWDEDGETEDSPSVRISATPWDKHAQDIFYATLDGVDVDVMKKKEILPTADDLETYALREKLSESRASELRKFDALQTLLSWRHHFSIPKVCLPKKFAAMKPDTRRQCLQRARERVEAAWHEA